MYITSKNACEHFGIHANTLRKWADEGKIAHIRSPSGQRLYDVSSVGKKIDTRTKICYARVSSVSQKEDLERQVLFLKQKYPDYEVVTDVGSGLNFKRKGFRRVLESVLSNSVSEIVVAHRDRLCRFGFELVQWICDKSDTKLVVLEQTSLSPTEELTKDLLSIIHVFSCRLYGLRKYSSSIKKDKDLPDSKPKENS